MFAHGLGQPTRTASLTPAPAALSPCGERPALPSLFGLAPGGVYHAGSVAGAAVRSCRTFSPLPVVAACAAMTHQARRLAAPKPQRGEGGRFVLCGTFPGVAPAGRYPAPRVDGARTFLPRGLSTLAGAAVRPTDTLRMGAYGRSVKPIMPSPIGKIFYPEDVVWPAVRSTGCRRMSRA
jgi:hypothetical protein